MKVLFCGGFGCTQPTFKRLFVLADEIGFMDAPSVIFNQLRDEHGRTVRGWGTIAERSPFRRRSLPKSPVTVSFHTPPSGPDLDLYSQYFQQDLGNAEFRRVFLEGLRNDDDFSAKFIDPAGSYVSGTGEAVRKAILSDERLATVDLRGDYDPTKAYEIGSDEGRVETLKDLLQYGSIAVTSAMVVSETSGLIPVTDDTAFSGLLATRSSHPSYVGGTGNVAPMLGLEIARSVLPDQALEELQIEDLASYRRKTQDAYNAWSTELDKLVASIDDLEPSKVRESLPKLIATEVAPRITEYQNEMVSAREKLFGGLLKSLVKWQVPTFSVAYVSGLSSTAAIAAFFAAGIHTAVAPAIVDYIISRRAIKRKNGLAYLVGLREGARHA